MLPLRSRILAEAISIQLVLHIAQLAGDSTFPTIGRLQEVHDIIKTRGCLVGPPWVGKGFIAVRCSCADDWATEIRQLRLSGKIKNIIAYL